MERRLGISEAARQLSDDLGREIAPREITLLFYNRVLSDRLAPIRRGRRRIDPTVLPAIADALRDRAPVTVGTAR